ncbi:MULTISPECIES: hypothetical protein [Clostridium]|uniref:Lipoprotein n=1 Tax=Clostridium aquiflavi TaxID=3073603 RepID=A0ABU1EHL3_9CLOT|nr:MULTISPECIES: hypothetical protein [unclassified Clostridium]MDR5587890.1 hypothetical protein [Clostridium sp. 5N-1]NFG61085.1 hypothetical protein [Clostridium botulinum]NFQ09329.1 hypothetical protein [Clostridium botulinum]
MKKKFIKLSVISLLCIITLVSCGKPNNTNNDTNNTTEQTQNENANSTLPGNVESSTAEVKKVVSIDDLKDKDQNAIKKVLGNPKSTDGDKVTYEKDDYTFEITYVDSKSAIIKIIPIKELKYPNDGINILNVLGISAQTPDVTAPIGLVWNNKFNTYKITVASDASVENKLSYIEIILDEKYAQ